MSKCKKCHHNCHCGRKCDYCSCYICNNIVIKTYEDYMGGNMIKKWIVRPIRKVWDWLTNIVKSWIG